MPCVFGHSQVNGESDETALSPGRPRRKRFSAALKAVLKVASVKLPFRRRSSNCPSAARGNNLGGSPITLGNRAEASSDSGSAPAPLLPLAEVRDCYGSVRASCRENDDFSSVVVATSILEPPTLLRNSVEKSSKCGKSQLQLVPAEALVVRHAASMHLPELSDDSIWMICNPLYFGYRHNSSRKQHFSDRRDQYTREFTSRFCKSGF